MLDQHRARRPAALCACFNALCFQSSLSTLGWVKLGCQRLQSSPG